MSSDPTQSESWMSEPILKSHDASPETDVPSSKTIPCKQAVLLSKQMRVTCSTDRQALVNRRVAAVCAISFFASCIFLAAQLTAFGIERSQAVFASAVVSAVHLAAHVVVWVSVLATQKTHKVRKWGLQKNIMNVLSLDDIHGVP